MPDDSPTAVLQPRFPVDWERFILAARQKLTGEEFEWCLSEATRAKPLSKLEGADLLLMESLRDSQRARIDRGQRG